MASPRPYTGATVSEHVVLAIRGAVTHAGVDPNALIEAEASSERRHEDARVPRELVGDMWRRAAKLVGEDVGLRAAEQLTSGGLDLVEYLARNSATLGEALDQMSRFAPLLADGLELNLHNDGERTTLGYQQPGKPFPASASEFVIGALARFLRQSVRPGIGLYAVHFSHPAPVSQEPHQRFFHTRVRFSQQRNELVFDAASLRLPIGRPDPRLREMLERHATLALSALPRTEELTGRVADLVGAGMKVGEATVEHVASTLNMGVRTLHRRLQEAGTSHREILDQVRHARAERFLEQRELTLAEIALELGFGDTSAFRKAFKRWEGVALSDYLGRQ